MKNEGDESILFCCFGKFEKGKQIRGRAPFPFLQIFFSKDISANDLF